MQADTLSLGFDAMNLQKKVQGAIPVALNDIVFPEECSSKKFEPRDLSLPMLLKLLNLLVALRPSRSC
jgi:hypothetical protein